MEGRGRGWEGKKERSVRLALGGHSAGDTPLLRRVGLLTVWREMDLEEKDAALVGRVGGAHDGGLPMEEIIADGPRAAACWRVLCEVLQLLVDTLGRHVSQSACFSRGRRSCGEALLVLFAFSTIHVWPQSSRPRSHKISNNEMDPQREK
jgi:hypothetical protein